MKIGFVENTFGNRLVFWFYRQENGRWVKIRTMKISPEYRINFLKKLSAGATLVPLGRGI